MAIGMNSLHDLYLMGVIYSEECVVSGCTLEHPVRRVTV